MGKWGDFFRKLAGDRAEELKADIDTAEKELETPPVPEPKGQPVKQEPKQEEKTVPTQPSPTTETPDITKLIADAVAAGNKPLVDRLEAIETAQKERASSELTAKVEAALREHVGVRWPESKKDELKKLLEGSYDTTIAMLKMVPTNPAVNRDAQKPTEPQKQTQELTPADKYLSTREAAKASIQGAFSAGLPGGSAQE